MTDAELDAVLLPARVMVDQLLQSLAASSDVTEPSSTLRQILGEQSAQAAKLHRIFAEVHGAKEALKLRAPRPAQRRPGDERGFQALGAMLATKLEVEQEAAAREALAKRRAPHATVAAHNELAAAAEAHVRGKVARAGRPA
ncbi:hypothetical protein KFE25_010392 [Diacronema lutheri]|uniref:Uncharacterized protein n=1 Tax=Diacronema lutheri TaxID=2081491 RepID=A0A8J5XEY4_DIALT|nr:hypothetical protein KFE25_010392 [Diacronema lutheri]